jgi:small basic protein
VIALLALIAGIVLGLVLEPTIPAGLLEGIFNDRVFVISFIGNVLVAALVVFLGDQLGVGAQLSTGVVVVFSIRIFANAAAIRRHLFKA